MPTTVGSSALNTYEIDMHQVLKQKVVTETQIKTIYQIKNNFFFEVSPDFEIDFVDKTMRGTIAVVKRDTHLDEKQLLQFALDEAVQGVNGYTWPARRLRERAVTVLNTLEPGSGNEWIKTLDSRRVAGQAQTAIVACFKKIILDNRWRVRDSAVIVKMGQWIDSYMADQENGVGLVNLMKLKIMIDKDLPVYSVDEVKRVNPV